MLSDEIITTADTEQSENEIKSLPVKDFKPFSEQPFKVRMDESMDELVESIKEYGVLSPILARPHEDGGYETISGHRRLKACEIAGVVKIPSIIKHLDDDEAVILLVDSNLQRENILPSEKAYAYQLKLEAMNRQGKRTDLTCSQIGNKLDKAKSSEVLAGQVGESKNQIFRYIRLTNLIDPLLDMVDNKKIAMNAAVELSYLGSREQSEVLKSIEKEEMAPSIAQASKIRRFSQEGKLSSAVIDSIMQEQKPQKIRITLKDEQVKKYFPKSYTPKQIEDTIMKLIENWARKRREPER